MKIVGATGLGGFWALEWAWRTFLGLIDRYWWGRFVGVRVGLAPCWTKLALRKKLRNLHAKSQYGQTDMARSTRLVMLIKNKYTLWGRKGFFLPVTYFPTNLVYLASSSERQSCYCPGSYVPRWWWVVVFFWHRFEAILARTSSMMRPVLFGIFYKGRSNRPPTFFLFLRCTEPPWDQSTFPIPIYTVSPSTTQSGYFCEQTSGPYDTKHSILFWA